MKKTNLAKKLTAMAMTGAMVMSMGMTAFAVEPVESDQGTASITKVLNKPENVLTPNTSFTFAIEYVEELTGVTDIGDVSSAVAFEDGNDTIAPSDVELKNTDTSLTYAEKLPLSVTLSNYTKPGVYRYKVTETTPADKYEGIDYDENVLYFDVAIGYEDGESALSVLYAKFVTTDDEGKTVKGDGTFTNNYGTGDEDGSLGNLVVTKKVSGNQVEAGKEYSFTVTITDREAGEEFYVIYGEDEATAVTENGTVTVPLMADESLTVYGLSESDKYTIAEADYNDEGYTTSFVVKDTNNTIETSVANTHDYDTDSHALNKGNDGKLLDATAEFTNTKNVTTPTGIAMTFAPYALMVVFAGVFAVMFLRKKREDF